MEHLRSDYDERRAAEREEERRDAAERQRLSDPQEQREGDVWDWIVVQATKRATAWKEEQEVARAAAVGQEREVWKSVESAFKKRAPEEFEGEAPQPLKRKKLPFGAGIGVRERR